MSSFTSPRHEWWVAGYLRERILRRRLLLWSGHGERRSKHHAHCRVPWAALSLRMYLAAWWFGCHQFYFPIYWEFHHPNWLSYFSEGFKPPTSWHVIVLNIFCANCRQPSSNTFDVNRVDLWKTEILLWTRHQPVWSSRIGFNISTQGFPKIGHSFIGWFIRSYLQPRGHSVISFILSISNAASVRRKCNLPGFP